jgi:hypothetical protein
MRVIVMSHLGKSMTKKFQFSYEDVFNGLANAIKSVGFSLKIRNFDNGHILASTGISLFSWGEDINIYVTEIDDYNTSVSLSSDLKVSLNFAAASKHEENFYKIINHLNKYLDENCYRKSFNNKISSSLRGDFSFIYNEFIKIHSLSLKDFIEESSNDDDDDTDKILEEFYTFLIDEQIKIIATQIDLIKTLVSDVEQVEEEQDLISSTMSTCLFLFMVIHSYSLSKLPQELFDALEEGFYFQSITLLYLEKFFQNLEEIYGENDILDSEMIHVIPMMMFDKNAKKRFNLKVSKEDFLIGLLNKFNIPKDFAIDIIRKFDEVLKVQYQRMIKSIMDEEEDDI